MKFTGKFLKGLPLPPVALSIKYYLSDRPTEQEVRFPLCEMGSESSRKAVERIVPLQTEPHALAWGGGGA